MNNIGGFQRPQKMSLQMFAKLTDQLMSLLKSKLQPHQRTLPKLQVIDPQLWSTAKQCKLQNLRKPQFSKSLSLKSSK